MGGFEAEDAEDAEGNDENKAREEFCNWEDPKGAAEAVEANEDKDAAFASLSLAAALFAPCSGVIEIWRLSFVRADASSRTVLGVADAPLPLS